MRCRKVRQNLSAYLDGSLPVAMQECIAVHLETCNECHNALDLLQNLEPLLMDLSAPALPDGLTAQVLARARERLEQRRAIKQHGYDPTTMPSWYLLRWWALETPAMRFAAVAILAIGLAAGIFLGKRTSSIPTRFAFSTIVRNNRQPDTMALYGFDSLFSDTSGSIEQAYLVLTLSSARKEG